ncbi:MAG TPA: hypothetical protein VGL86_06540 [Polyangia bacterium]
MLLLLAVPAAHAQPGHLVVVSTVAPLDGQRLADVLRSYLDGYDVEVRAGAAPASSGDLRRDLAATGAAADDVRAFAAIRVTADGANIEIQLADALAHKFLVATMARPQRDEDLYRTLALKVQLLLASALYESAPALATSAPPLARLAMAPAAQLVAPAPPPHRAPRLRLEVAYSLFTFPLSGAVQSGVVVAARYERRLLAVGLSIDALAPLTAQKAEVSAVVHTVPIVASAGVVFRGRHVDAGVDGAAELVVVLVDPTDSAGQVRAERTVEPALGLRAAAAVHLGAIVRLYLRASLFGVLTGERYLVDGAPLVDLSRLQAGGEAGLTVALW